MCYTCNNDRFVVSIIVCVNLQLRLIILVRMSEKLSFECDLHKRHFRALAFECSKSDNGARKRASLSLLFVQISAQFA